MKPLIESSSCDGDFSESCEWCERGISSYNEWTYEGSLKKTDHGLWFLVGADGDFLSVIQEAHVGAFH